MEVVGVAGHGLCCRCLIWMEFHSLLNLPHKRWCHPIEFCLLMRQNSVGSEQLVGRESCNHRIVPSVPVGEVFEDWGVGLGMELAECSKKGIDVGHPQCNNGSS